MTIQIYSIGDIKHDLMNVGRLFDPSDTLGGINSRHINALEERFFKKTGRKCVFVDSCTNGIYLTLKKLRVKGRHIIIPPITFFGIASAVIKAGGIPLYSRVDKYGLMDISSIYELVATYNVAAIIPAHINNRYVPTERITDLDKTIIEDAAPAFGATRVDGSCVLSSTRNASVISFSYGKPLTAGEGGMIFTNDNDEDWYRGQRYSGLSNVDGKYGYGAFDVTEPELKMANTGLNAALIMTKMRSFNDNLLRAKEIASYYHNTFGSFHDGELNPLGNNQTYVMLTVRRKEVMTALEENDIKSYISHRPVYMCQAFEEFNGAFDYKETCRRYFSKILHIPCRSDLTDEQIELISTVVRRALQ